MESCAADSPTKESVAKASPLSTKLAQGRGRSVILEREKTPAPYPLEERRKPQPLNLYVTCHVIENNSIQNKTFLQWDGPHPRVNNNDAIVYKYRERPHP
jgi:hypothetical protein